MYTILNNKVVKILSYSEISSEEIELNVKNVESNIADLKKAGKQYGNEVTRLEKYKETLKTVKDLENLTKKDLNK